jgi:hypothetical protein
MGNRNNQEQAEKGVSVEVGYQMPKETTFVIVCISDNCQSIPYVLDPL